jgi:hypothetical protein
MILYRLYTKLLRTFHVHRMKSITPAFEYRELPISISLYKGADLKGVIKAWETTDNKYQIFFDEIKGYKHLRIRRSDMKPVHNWRDLQTIKNDLWGKNVIAIEIYPYDSNIVDLSNSYHLWTWDGIDVPNLIEIYK